jgi:hypothetical protein
MAWTSVIFMVGMEWDEGVARAIGCDTRDPRNGNGVGSPRCCVAARKRISISSPRGPVKRGDRTRTCSARAAAAALGQE